MTAKVERLVNLTVALLEARRPLTFEDIRRTTGYYAQGAPESARRMFERDKDELRRLGVPVETRRVPLSDDLGYVVDRREYELADVDLTAGEVAALALAVRLTGEDSSRATLSRLAARAPDPIDAGPVPALRVGLGAQVVSDSIADAVVHRRVLSFAYRGADQQRTERRVEPWAIVNRRGSWYLIGHDRDRDGRRTFRLDRIVGPARADGPTDAFVRPDGFDPSAAVAGSEARATSVMLTVRPRARWALELRGGAQVDGPSTVEGSGAAGGDWVAMRLDGFIVERDLAWLVGLAPDVLVSGPADVRGAAVDALSAVVAAHAPAGEAVS
ncbi:MAG: WYL domain-containing protein [Nitriliruptoraceae bacterium]